MSAAAREGGMLDIVANAGRTMTNIVEQVGGMSIMAGQAFAQVPRRPFEFSLLIRQLYLIGVQSLSITFLTAAFTGAVMALQFHWGLARFGAGTYIGRVISIGFVMELGPVLTSLLVGGRVGAGITAEIGSMKVTEQIDAMRVLGSSPIRKLVLPRILACMIAMPLLCMISNVIGTWGGMLVTMSTEDLTARFYMDQVITTVDIGELMHGEIKAMFFGFIIAICGCYGGFRTAGGTEGVGLETTRTVVFTSIAILVSDFILSKALLPFT